MSQDDDDDRVPPRRPKPKSKSSRPPEASGSRPEPSTWRPNILPSGSKTSSRSVKNKDKDKDKEPLRVPPGPSWWERVVFGRVSTGQLAVLCRQFAAYLDAGVDILKALTSLERQFARTALGPILGRIAIGVRKGDALAETAAREPQAFDALFLSMIKVAEARGGVPETLRLLARHYEARQSLIRQARSAMIYPIAVLVVASAVVALMTKWLLPMFMDLLRGVAGQGAQLPLPSRILMAFSDFVQTLGWWVMPVVMIGFPLLVLRTYKTKLGKRLMDEVAVRTPGLGLLVRKIDTTRLARTLAALLGSGVDIGTSLALAADVVRLDPFRRAVRAARAAVLDGEPLSEALDASGRFGTDVIAVISSGEETGKLPECFDHLADDYEEQVAYMVKNLGQLVQPLLMILIGGLVLFIVLAVLLPYISILTSLSR
jgi:type IV pilus assembly protein PilC